MALLQDVVDCANTSIEHGKGKLIEQKRIRTDECEAVIAFEAGDGPAPAVAFVVEGAVESAAIAVGVVFGTASVVATAVSAA
jgi:hypothetical protein